MGTAPFQTKVAIRSILDMIEIALKETSVKTLEQNVGTDWWEKVVPKSVVNKCIFWQKNHQGDPFRIGEVKKTCDYMSLGNLITIIRVNQNYFANIFPEESISYLRQMLNLRDALSHPTDIDVDDIRACKICIRGIASQLPNIDLNRVVTELDKALELMPSIPVHNLPPAMFSDFFGREKDIEFVDQELLYHPNTWLLLIDGIGGIGKSSLAFNIAQTIIGEIGNQVSDFQHVIWISAKSNRLSLNFDIEEQEPDFDSLEMLLDSLVDFFQLQILATGMIAEKRELVNQALEITKCLLIVDNLETVSDDTIYSFFDRVPSHNKILLTSRDRRYKLLEGKGLPIEGLNEEDALLLIRSKIDKNHIESLETAPKQVLIRIVEKAHGHPLIIECLLHQIYLGKPVEQALSEMENTELFKVFEFCFGSTYSMLEESSQMILMCLALFDTSVGLKEVSFVCDLTQQQTGSAIEQLKRFSLIKEKVEEGISLFYLLPVISKYVSYQMSQRKILVTKVVQRFEMYQKELSRIGSLTSDESPFLLNFSFTNDIDKLAAAIANSALNDYYHSGNYQEVVEALNSALTLSPSSSYICQIRALVEKSEGFFGEAAKWYDKAVSNDAKNGLLWRLWGDLERGFPNYLRASEKYEEAVRCDHTDRRAWNGLGYSQSQIAKELWEKGNFKGHTGYRNLAEQSFSQALYVNPQISAEIIHNLKVFHQKGFNLFHLQNYEEVIRCCTEGLKLDKSNKYLKDLKERAERRI